jgi:hypothetical protein
MIVPPTCPCHGLAQTRGAARETHCGCLFPPCNICPHYLLGAGDRQGQLGHYEYPYAGRIAGRQQHWRGGIWCGRGASGKPSDALLNPNSARSLQSLSAFHCDAPNAFSAEPLPPVKLGTSYTPSHLLESLTDELTCRRRNPLLYAYHCLTRISTAVLPDRQPATVTL